MRRCAALLAACCVLCLMAGHSLQQKESVLHEEGYSDSDNCNTYATFGAYFNNERGKNVTCPYFLDNTTYLSHNNSSCRDLDNLMQNNSVRWCFHVSPNRTEPAIGAWSVCLGADGNRTVHWPKNNMNNDPEKIQVLPDGQLNLVPIEVFMGDAGINCSVVNREGRECGFEKFDFTLLSRTSDQPKPRIEFSPEKNPTAHVGQLMFLCVSGSTVGVRDLNWNLPHDGLLETINITSKLSGQPCLTCDCAHSTYAYHAVVRELLRNKTMGGERGVAFSILGYEAGANSKVLTESWKCSGVPSRFISFLIIDGARLEDNGMEVEVEIVAFPGDRTTGSYTLKTSYVKHGPFFGNIDPLMYNGHHAFMCNAFISGDAHLEWRNDADGSLVHFLYSGEFANISDLNNATLDQLCSREKSSLELFAVRFNNSYLKDTNNATYINQAVALVQCSHHPLPTSIRYTCFSSDSTAPGTSFTLFVSRSSSTHVVTIAVTLAVFVTVLLLVIVVVVVIVCLRYSRIKAEPRRMCPVPPHIMNSLISATLTPYIFDEEPDSSHLEFPRENLQFLKVLGEGQFGRVFKAIADGICPQDNNRKVVAVKTLKDNARPSDKDDLRSELDTMRRIEPHPNILNFLGMCSETATEPLYILMEFAMYGSLKDYLKSVKSGKLPNPQRLLSQQQSMSGHAPPPPPHSPGLLRMMNTNSPTALATSKMMSSFYPATNQQSTLSLCPYHQSQLARFGSMPPPPPPTGTLGDAPGNQGLLHPTGAQAADESVSLYDMDPVSKAHATRLLRLLNSEYCLQHLADDVDCCHSDAGGGATIQSGQSAYSYRQLGDMCVRRACLDDYPYWYGTLPRYDYYNSYYNYHSTSQKRERCSESPFTDTPGTVAPLLPPPPIYVNVYEGEGDGISSNDPHQEECVCHEEGEACACYQPSSNLNQYHNLSASNTCIYCCHCTADGGGGEGEAVQAPPHQQTAPGASNLTAGEGNTFSEADRGLSYFEVLDFAQQIARGMEHLERMKCVHRDLAARNVLIAEGFLLKIGDFGLARDLSEKDYYRKVTPGRIPARWMALESLEERTHTSKSDVWAYGVVLWEVLTYGGLPYGKSAVASGIESLAAHIKAGHRLPQPLNCSDQLYGLLRMCWEEDPELRPSFGQLVNVFTTLLESTQEYFSLSMEDAVHQPMTAHLEATAVAGMSSSVGPERAAAQPTILTPPYGDTIGPMGMMGSPVHSTSYIDEPDTITRESLSPTPDPASYSSHLAPPIDLGNTALSQSYLNLIADSTNHNGGFDENSDEGSAPLDVVINSARPTESKGHQLDVVVNGASPAESKGHQFPSAGPSPVTTNGLQPVGNGAVATNPPDVVPDALRQKAVPTSLPLDAWNTRGKEGRTEPERTKERAKVNGGHSRMRQRSIHCLETAV